MNHIMTYNLYEIVNHLPVHIDTLDIPVPASIRVYLTGHGYMSDHHSLVPLPTYPASSFVSSNPASYLVTYAIEDDEAELADRVDGISNDHDCVAFILVPA